MSTLSPSPTPTTKARASHERARGDRLPGHRHRGERASRGSYSSRQRTARASKDAVVVERTPDGEVKLHQFKHPGGPKAPPRVQRGGALIGLLCIAPCCSAWPSEEPLAAAWGPSSNNKGVNDNFLQDLGARLLLASAVIVLGAFEAPDQLNSWGDFKPYGGEVLRTSSERAEKAASTRSWLAEGAAGLRQGKRVDGCASVKSRDMHEIIGPILQILAVGFREGARFEGRTAEQIEQLEQAGHDWGPGLRVPPPQHDSRGARTHGLRGPGSRRQRDDVVLEENSAKPAPRPPEEAAGLAFR